MNAFLLPLGWDAFFERQRAEDGGASSRCARVVAEHKRYFVVNDGQATFLSRITGKLRHAAVDRAALPVVGDFVRVNVRSAEKTATIEAVLDRRTTLVRKAAGADAEQPLCSNVDAAFILVALDGTPNPRRVERFLALCESGGVRPIVLFTKLDLCPDATAHLAALGPVLGQAERHCISAVTGSGLGAVAAQLSSGRTAVALGPSGAGKSTLVNTLLGEARQEVRDVRAGDGKGRHTTTSRSLFTLPGGGMIIDTPGIRELELWDTAVRSDDGFSDIAQFAQDCRFRDCRHDREPGCAVRGAVGQGRLDAGRVAAFGKLESERRARTERLREKHRGGRAP